MATYLFRIYVAGATRRAHAAVANLRTLCETSVDDDYELEVIDVLAQPGRAEAERILATPTVIRLVPLPRRRVIGDLADHRLAALALDLPGPEGAEDNKGGSN